MKLFFYDTKHQQVIDSLDVGELTGSEAGLVNKVIDFLEDVKLIDGRYKNLILAENIDVIYGEEYERELVIRGAK
jgi:hypothetical protein